MPCPVTGLRYEQRRDIEETWRKAVGNTPREFKGAGINLVIWMFDTIPNMRACFGKFQASSANKNLVANEMLLAHSRSVIVTIDNLVRLLDYPRHLKDEMRTVAKTHVNLHPSIGSEYFEPFAAQFHVFLRAAMRVRPHRDDVRAWRKFLYTLVDMVKAEERALKGAKEAHTQHHGAPCCGIL